MIRPATDSLKERPGGTAFVIGLLVLALVLPAIVLLTASAAERTLDRWMEQYHPVVYLVPDAGEAEAESLAGDIRAWEGVAECRLREPQEGFELAADRVGRERLGEAGVKPAMFPYTLAIRTAGLATSGDVASRIKALEAREAVDRVDVPAPDVGSWGEMVVLVRTLGLVLMALFALLACAATGRFLLELRRRERAELSLLERFGASRMQLRRPTWIRGGVLGVWAGIASTTLLLAFAVYSRTMEANLLEGVAATPWSWLVVIVPLIVAPLTGLAAGVWAATRPIEEATREFEGLESLLDHG